MDARPLYFTDGGFETEMELGELQAPGSPFPLGR